MRAYRPFEGVIGLSLLCGNAAAYEAVDVFDLSLEDMLAIEVISTSRKEEKQQLAPGVVTVVTAQEIARFGARHLRDVLDRLVATQVLGSHQDQHSKTSLRSLNSSHHEDTVLILLNGRPLRQATDGGLNSDLYIGFPIKSIERIEIVRGPGSVIYGTNAMAGVLNIITKDAASTVNATDARVTAGSFGFRQAQLNGLWGDQDASLLVSLNHTSADGDPVDGITDEDGNLGRYETGAISNNLLLTARYHGFTMNGMIMENNLDSANSAFQLPSNPIDLERFYLDLGYRHPINDAWDISLNYTHGRDTAQWQINEGLGDNFSEGRSQLWEIVARGSMGAATNLLLGTSHARNKSGFDRGLPKGSKNSNTSAYAQIDHMTSPQRKLIAGLQWNKPDRIDADLSPRLGIIQGFGDNWWLKLLYSEAYRSPNLVETDLDAPQLKGVPTLDPETIATYDAQLIYQTSKSQFALALYHSKLENLIVRVPGTPTTHENEGFVKFRGIEFEARLEVSQGWQLVGNFTHQESENDEGVEQGTFAPETMLKLGAIYNIGSGLNIAVFNSYFGESTDLSQTNIAPAINPNADAYNMLTANISVDTGKLWGWGKPEQSTLSLYLDNLLDEEVFAPDLNFANKNNTIPHHWGRGAYLSYDYRF